MGIVAVALLFYVLTEGTRLPLGLWPLEPLALLLLLADVITLLHTSFLFAWAIADRVRAID